MPRLVSALADKGQTPARIASLILAGGASSRMGTAKQGLELAGRSLLESVVEACAATSPVVVVAPAGPARGWLSDPSCVRLVLEDPPGGGPVAGLVAGLSVLGDVDEVIVLACDLPGAAGIVDRLLGEELAHGSAGVVPVDDEGWEQWLAARYRLDALRGVLEKVGSGRDVSVRRALKGLDVTRIALPTEMLGDVDTPEQARAAGLVLDEG